MALTAACRCARTVSSCYTNFLGVNMLLDNKALVVCLAINHSCLPNAFSYPYSIMAHNNLVYRSSHLLVFKKYSVWFLIMLLDVKIWRGKSYTPVCKEHLLRIV